MKIYNPLRYGVPLCIACIILYVKISSGLLHSNFFLNKVKSSVQRSSSQHRIIVPDGTLKERVDAYLAKSFTNYSRSLIGEMCERGNVCVNGKFEKKNFKVSEGDEIVVSVEFKSQGSVQAENIPISILYEDAHIIVVNKPAGNVIINAFLSYL